MKSTFRGYKGDKYMGTIRNRVVIIHHYKKEEIEELRKDAIEFFQNIISENLPYLKFDVDKEMITPIMESLINHEYTFVINGECSKIGWTESDLFEEKRNKWIEENKDKCQNIILVDFGEDYEANMKEFK